MSITKEMRSEIIEWLQENVPCVVSDEFEFWENVIPGFFGVKWFEPKDAIAKKFGVDDNEDDNEIGDIADRYMMNQMIACMNYILYSDRFAPEMKNELETLQID